MSSSLKVAIVGASGYVGAELATLLMHHPHVGRTAYISRSLSGSSVAAHFSTLRGYTDAVFESAAAAGEFDVVFFATPHGVAMQEAGALIDSGAVVIDLSPDFRLRDIEVFERWYGAHAAAELTAQAVYGLTESARRHIRTANLIACPGCFATAAELALIPLAAADMIRGTIIVDAKSGVSGAGRRTERADLLFAEHAENFKAYALDGHRHHPEIQQAILEFAGRVSPLVFVPHLLPATRGIYASIYVSVDKNADCAAAVRDYWAGEQFIDVLEDGVPELSAVSRTNRVQLSARPIDDTVALLIVALDNLQKGAAGQAVQNMNVRFGFEESAGLLGARHI